MILPNPVKVIARTVARGSSIKQKEPTVVVVPNKPTIEGVLLTCVHSQGNVMLLFVVWHLVLRRFTFLYKKYVLWNVYLPNAVAFHTPSSKYLTVIVITLH